MPEGDFETIRWSIDDGLATITLARPDKRNAVNQAMFEELGRATAMVGDDPAVRAVVLRAEGPSFCAGIDLLLIGELAGLASGGGFSTFVELAQRPFRRLALMAKPSVAAVQGHALGAGFQLALACDLRVAGPDVQFGMLEARYGIIPDLGGMHHLARLVGPARAKELIYSGRHLKAEEARQIGLVDQVFKPEEVYSKAVEAARTYADGPRAALRAAKVSINWGARGDFRTGIVLEREAFADLFATEDQKAGMQSLLDQGPGKAKFVGR
jgi:enoyl-CoA hydratase/carnithine racemase